MLLDLQNDKVCDISSDKLGLPRMNRPGIDIFPERMVLIQLLKCHRNVLVDGKQVIPQSQGLSQFQVLPKMISSLEHLL